MVHHFDHRYATYRRDGTIRDTTLEEHQNPTFEPMPRYWVEEGEVEERLVKRDRDGNVVWRWEQPWLLGFRDIARNTDERTAIFTLVPRVAVNHKLPLVIFDAADAEHALVFLALVNSIAFDYVTRQSVGGTSLGYFVLKQLPLPRPDDIPIPRWSQLVASTRNLVGTQSQISEALGQEEVAVWKTSRRRSMRAAVDAMCFDLFGFTEDEVAHAMNCFLVLRKREVAEAGEFRSLDEVMNALHELRLSDVGT